MKTTLWEQKVSELAAIAAGEPQPPGRSDELVQVSEGIDGNPIAMAVITLSGSRPGPRVWVQAQTHGDEASATEAILAVLRSLDASRLSGVLVAAPAMHSAAVRHFMRESPLDGKNGNRIWGIDWARLGHTRVFSYIWMERVAEMIRAFRPDLVVDLHDGGIPLRIISHALYSVSSTEFRPELEELCWKSGMKVVWANRGGRFGGSINDRMNEWRIPSLTLESGGTGQLLGQDIEEMARGLRNVLRSVALLEGELERRTDRQLLMVGADWVRAGRAGLFYRDVELGQMVREGQRIGRIANVFGHVVEEVVAPRDGLVFGLRYAAVANVGDYVANIGHVSG